MIRAMTPEQIADCIIDRVKVGLSKEGHAPEAELLVEAMAHFFAISLIEKFKAIRP